jgi:Protein of unknown function (DUF3034)
LVDTIASTSRSSLGVVGWLSRLLGVVSALRVQAALIGLLCVPAAHAQRAPFDSPFTPDLGKLPLTAGFTDIDGAGGGGLVPWALITGYGTSDSWGANAHYTEVPLRDYRLRSYGVAVGALDRVEASFTADKFDAAAVPLGGLAVEQHVYGLKVRLTGDAVYDQDSWAPQTAVGFQYKKNTGISGGGGLQSAEQLGATSTSGTDWYLSATKIYLSQSLLVNLTLRYTKANEFGLLGFGGDLKRGRSVEPEGTVAYVVARTVAVGAEYRGRPHNLTVDDEHDAWDVFVAWTATRHLSLVAAYVRLGSILEPVTRESRNQDGAYVSLQAGF